MSSDPRAARNNRRWAVGVGVVGAALSAATIGLASAPSAWADTPDDVLNQASQDLTQALQTFEQAPEASLDAHQIAALTPEEHLIGTMQSFNSVLEADEAALPAADQAGLADVDLGVLQADQGCDLDFLVDQSQV